MEIETADEIAIVGIGCNFPGGEGIENFWKVLEEGINCTVDIPPERFNTEEWYDPDDNKPGKIRTTRAALLNEFNSFDNQLFGINDMEAERMDPQQKLLVECTYKALEDAGVPVEAISGTKTGVFIGLMNRDYELVTSKSVNEINHYDGTGAAMSIAANRVSFTFNLTGPSLTIDTACSSFLFALHYALQAIKSGDCEAAICAGVNCLIEPSTFVSLSKAKMISPEGMSKPFSKKADGYGRGEGCGVVFLKPLKKAKEDYSKIWGVINISAVNQNGRSITPITRPSRIEQEKLLRSIYESRVDPSVVQYIEAHGTGTAAGDPTEAESLGSVVCKNRSSQVSTLKIGSVKGNIGHTESAAGAAGLIKVLLMMHHGKIVPSLHYSKEMSSIDTERLNLAIPTSVEPWEESREYGRVAGINCFGFGGTNAHVVVRQMKQVESLPAFKRPLELVLLSAASSKSLQMTMADTADQLSTRKSVTLPSLAYTSACRRSHASYRYRKAFVTNSLQHLQQAVTSAASTEPAPWKVEPQLVFVFCGNGVTLKEFSEALLSSEPVFRDKCKEIEALFQKHAPISLLPPKGHSPKDLLNPELSQPLLFTLQVATASLLKYWGIKPVSAVGHSVGEIAAAHFAGYLSLADAVKVIYHRSRLQAKPAGGRMLVVGNIPVQEIADCLPRYSGKVCIAAFNSPVSCTLSGNSLKDVVIVCGNRQSECMQNITGIDDENVSFHILTVASLFQKASLKDLQKTVHAWINSMDMKRFRQLSGSVFQQTENFERINSVTSYFTCKSVPLAVLRMQRDITMLSDIPFYESQKQLFKQNGVYVVVGGLTGLGFETVKFIAENGGGCIAILSRKSPSKEKQDELKALEQRYKGSKVVFVQCDVTSTSDAEKAFRTIANISAGSPVKGVFQSAVVLHDGHVETLTLADFQKVLSPKVAGTLNLHWATRGQELDYFVCYSSVTSFLGNSTQANYAAANSFLDVFCLYRRNCGLAGQAINWGALNLGILLNQTHIQNVLESKGIDILQVDEIHDYLRKSLLLNKPQQAVVKLNFQTLSTHVFTRIVSLKSRFVSLMSEELRSKIETSEETQVQDTALIKSEDYIISLVSDLTRLKPDELTMNTPLSSLGMDSMLAMTIQNRVFRERKVDIPLLKLLDPHTTLSNLVLVLEETSNANGTVVEKKAVDGSAENGSWL
ncbi:PREDICTED: phthiocerol/phenolphthiocerol synthesis polyketide synthase type I PpsD-like [Calidris pugnax]|uniref:phthiocerol/phenolphthiocerol synthesis polyketide synthase type I PpsD-like n=1 Tax=Calidris pugnax TaxID=198806 RepID=UPI00071C652C|nr:PREDICTED: phthiocerol/phenolphthiocerol synthesis polyketide synthase type I PpsD-like [Calidris pugnax]